jgi:hypothetical protein
MPHKFKVGDFVLLSITEGFGGAKGIVGQVVPRSEVPEERCGGSGNDKCQWAKHMMFLGPCDEAEHLIKNSNGYWYFPDPDSWASVKPIGRP